MKKRSSCSLKQNRKIPFHGEPIQFAEPDEEAKGIDGYIGNIPVSIKPYTYQVKQALPEHIEVKIIYYRKIENGIEVDYGSVL